VDKVDEVEEAKIQPKIDENTWEEFVVAMHREYGVTPDVGNRSVNDVLQDVVFSLIEAEETEDKE